LSSYESIKGWKETHIADYMSDSESLNTFHDEVMKKVFDVASARLKSKPPCSFVWFITGSGGRFEQGLISDQDHGIVYSEDSQEANHYFHELGKEISLGLEVVGFPLCEGKVMSSNPLWCQAVTSWKSQVVSWMEESSWVSIRNLQIFYDARRLIGDSNLLFQIKGVIHDYCHEHPSVLARLLENVKHVKKTIGPLGQIIVEEKGLHAGAIDLKYSAFIPYVNAVRLLAWKEGISETSTINRLKELSKLGKYEDLSAYQENFLQLLQFRLKHLSRSASYDDSHYLYVKRLTKEDQKIIKKILKDGRKLQQYVQRMIEKGGNDGI
jgi:CBS domain-containing protein